MRIVSYHWAHKILSSIVFRHSDQRQKSIFRPRCPASKGDVVAFIHGNSRDLQNRSPTCSDVYQCHKGEGIEVIGVDTNYCNVSSA